jgi:hypothetical protein
MDTHDSPYTMDVLFTSNVPSAYRREIVCCHMGLPGNESVNVAVKVAPLYDELTFHQDLSCEVRGYLLRAAFSFWQDKWTNTQDNELWAVRRPSECGRSPSAPSWRRKSFSYSFRVGTPGWHMGICCEVTQHLFVTGVVLPYCFTYPTGMVTLWRRTQKNYIFMVSCGTS